MVESRASKLALIDLDVVVAGTRMPQVILGLATAARATLLKGINAPTTVVMISAYIAMDSQITFASAVSTTKVRVTMTTYTQSADIFTTAVGALMPLSKVARAAVARPNITWGILVPATTTSRSINASLDALDSTIYSEVTLKARDYSRSIVHMNKTTSYMPAIIDTAGDDGASKMVLSKSSNLVSTDRPTLMTYKYTTGDFV
jgi:hypothetical protein